MRILFSLVWLCCTAVLPAAEVGLETLPWTDAAWFWTADGPALPRINTNLSGRGTISIGGESVATPASVSSTIWIGMRNPFPPGSGSRTNGIRKIPETRRRFRLRITCERDDYLAREEPPLHLFFCDRFCELESHGPTRLLYPGERISLSEQWTP